MRAQMKLNIYMRSIKVKRKYKTCPINIWSKCIVNIGHLDEGDVDVDPEHVVSQQAKEGQAGDLEAKVSL